MTASPLASLAANTVTWGAFKSPRAGPFLRPATWWVAPGLPGVLLLEPVIRISGLDKESKLASCPAEGSAGSLLGGLLIGG